MTPMDSKVLVMVAAALLIYKHRFLSVTSFPLSTSKLSDEERMEKPIDDIKCVCKNKNQALLPSLIAINNVQQTKFKIGLKHLPKKQTHKESISCCSNLNLRDQNGSTSTVSTSSLKENSKKSQGHETKRQEQFTVCQEIGKGLPPLSDVEKAQGSSSRVKHLPRQRSKNTTTGKKLNSNCTVLMSTDPVTTHLVKKKKIIPSRKQKCRKVRPKSKLNHRKLPITFSARRRRKLPKVKTTKNNITEKITSRIILRTLPPKTFEEINLTENQNEQEECPLEEQKGQEGLQKNLTTEATTLGTTTQRQDSISTIINDDISTTTTTTKDESSNENFEIGVTTPKIIIWESTDESSTVETESEKHLSSTTERSVVEYVEDIENIIVVGHHRVHNLTLPSPKIEESIIIEDVTFETTDTPTTTERVVSTSAALPHTWLVRANDSRVNTSIDNDKQPLTPSTDISQQSDRISTTSKTMPTTPLTQSTTPKDILSNGLQGRGLGFGSNQIEFITTTINSLIDPITQITNSNVILVPGPLNPEPSGNDLENHSSSDYDSKGYSTFLELRKRNRFKNSRLETEFLFGPKYKNVKS